MRSFVDFQIIEEVNDLLSIVKCYGGRENVLAMWNCNRDADLINIFTLFRI